jgi:hypothetical protein
MLSHPLFTDVLHHTRLEQMPRSLSAALNAFAGVFNVFAKTVGSVAADPDNSHEGGDE